MEFECFHDPWDVWFEVKVSPAEDATLAVFFRDITERKLGQIALAESEERLHWLQQNAQAGLWDWDMVTNDVTWSEEVLRHQWPGSGDRESIARGDFLDNSAPSRIATRWSRRSAKALRIRKRIDVQYLDRASRAGHAVDRGPGPDGVRRGRQAAPHQRHCARHHRAPQTGLKRRWAFVEAGSVLSVLVDFESTVQSVARLAVRFIADYCVVDMVSPLGRIERLAYAHRDLQKESLLGRGAGLEPAGMGVRRARSSRSCAAPPARGLPQAKFRTSISTPWRGARSTGS